MNVISKFTYGLVLSAFAFSAAVFTSCEDAPEEFEHTSGKPSVKYIRCLSTEVANANDSVSCQYVNGQLVKSAYPGSTIAIIGENMRSVKEIWFNDQQGTLNINNLTENVLVSSIPKSMPDVVSDKIFMITIANDTVTYDFRVIHVADSI